MDFITDFFSLPMKKKIFVLGAIAGWYFSIQFSKAGFGLKFSNLGWLATGLGLLVTILELAINDRDQKPTLSLVFFGLIAYGYGIITNIMGLWSAGNGNVAFNFNDPYAAGIAIVVGIMLECIPEPLIMLAYGRAREADPIAIVSELFSGKLMSGSGSHNQSKNQNKNNQRYDTSSQVKSYDFSDSGPITEPKINTSNLFAPSGKEYKHNQSKNPQNPRWQSGRKN